jgi:hypothetical protein
VRNFNCLFKAYYRQSKHGLPAPVASSWEELDEVLKEEATALADSLEAETHQLVHVAWRAIGRVARELRAKSTLTESEIDALL